MTAVSSNERNQDVPAREKCKLLIAAATNLVKPKNTTTMKIIATAGRDKYIMEASTYEVGHIMGAYFGSEFQLEIGQDVPVSELYESTREIVAGAKELTDQSEKVLKLMRSLAKFGATVGPIAKNILVKQNNSNK